MRPKSRVLGIVYRTLATHLIRKAGFKLSTAHTGAVTLIQCFGSALNAQLHFHMLFLDGVYVERPDGSLRFRWVKAPTSAELTALAHTIARRVGRFLERQGLLERDAENSYLAGEAVEAGPMDQLLGHSITYRIAVGPRRAQGVHLANPAGLRSRRGFADTVGKVAGFSLHAGVAATARERADLERLRGVRASQQKRSAFPVRHEVARVLIKDDSVFCHRYPTGTCVGLTFRRCFAQFPTFLLTEFGGKLRTSGAMSNYRALLRIAGHSALLFGARSDAAESGFFE